MQPIEPIDKPFSDEYIADQEKKAFSELTEISENSRLTRGKLNYWLIKYEDFYSKFRAYNSSLYNYLRDDKKVVRLSDFIENGDGEWFLDLYSQIEEFVDNYSEEEVLANELSKLKTLHNQDEIDKWFSKHKDKFYETYITLAYDNELEFSIGDDILVARCKYKEDIFEFYISGSDIKHTVEFTLICFEYFEYSCSPYLPYGVN